MSQQTLQEIGEALGLEELSLEQEKVIQTIGRPTSIIACAGSGKTTTLVARALYMELEYGLKPYELLIISFTRKAVEDIEKRYRMARTRLGLPNYKPTFATFHSFYNKMISRDPEFQEYQIMSVNHFRFSLMQKIKNFSNATSTKAEIVDAIIQKRSWLINKGYSIDGIENYKEHLIHEKMPFTLSEYETVVTEYNNLKEQNKYMDFDDLQGFMLRMLKDPEKGPIVKEKFKQTYKHVFIDEYQDINPVQNEIMTLFIDEIGTQNLSVVGDDDQSIYAFRGSDVDHIIDFEYTHLNAQLLRLSTNYRCPQNVLSFVVPSIETNEHRVKKQLQVAKTGGDVKFIDTGEHFDEFLDDLITDFRGMSQPNDLAVLVRDNSLRMLIGDLLLRRGVPVDIQDLKYSIYQSTVYTDLMGAITTIKESDNHEFLKKSWIYAPNIKKESLSYLETSNRLWVEEMKAGRLDIGNYRRRIVERVLASDDALECIEQVYLLYKKQYESGAKKGFYNMDTVLETFDYMKSITNNQTFREYEAYNQEIKRQLQDQVNKQHALKIHTIHGVKGLEFKNVYIYNPIDRYFLRSEHKGYEMTKKAIEEERRLFYVAVTRAIEKVVFVYDFNEDATFLQECKDGEGYIAPITPKRERVEGDNNGDERSEDKQPKQERKLPLSYNQRRTINQYKDKTVKSDTIDKRKIKLNF